MLHRVLCSCNLILFLLYAFLQSKFCKLFINSSKDLVIFAKILIIIYNLFCFLVLRPAQELSSSYLITVVRSAGVVITCSLVQFIIIQFFQICIFLVLLAQRLLKHKDRLIVPLVQRRRLVVALVLLNIFFRVFPRF